MQDQEKKFLGGIMYIGMLVVVFVAGVLYEYSYQPLPIPVQIVEVTKLIEVPQVIETVRVVEQCDPSITIKEDKGWFK